MAVDLKGRGLVYLRFPGCTQPGAAPGNSQWGGRAKGSNKILGSHNASAALMLPDNLMRGPPPLASPWRRHCTRIRVLYRSPRSYLVISFRKVCLSLYEVPIFLS